MKQKEILLNTAEVKKLHEEVGEEHESFSLETPLREDAFELDDDLKVELIEKHFRLGHDR
jgi:GTP cyclohydrolase IA